MRRKYLKGQHGGTLIETALVLPILVTIIFFVVESGMIMMTRIAFERAVDHIRDTERVVIADLAEGGTTEIDSLFRRPDFSLQALQILEETVPTIYRTYCSNISTGIIDRKYYRTAADYAAQNSMSEPLAHRPRIMTIAIECNYRAIAPYLLPARASLAGERRVEAILLLDDVR